MRTRHHQVALEDLRKMRLELHLIIAGGHKGSKASSRGGKCEEACEIVSLILQHHRNDSGEAEEIAVEELLPEDEARKVRLTVLVWRSHWSPLGSAASVDNSRRYGTPGESYARREHPQHLGDSPNRYHGKKKTYEVLVNPMLLQLRAPGTDPTGVASVTQRNGGLWWKSRWRMLCCVCVATSRYSTQGVKAHILM